MGLMPESDIVCVLSVGDLVKEFEDMQRLQKKLSSKPSSSGQSVSVNIPSFRYTFIFTVTMEIQAGFRMLGFKE